MPIYDAIVIGGSAAGLSATMSLSRALANVVCIDSGRPCNRWTSESHNFITHDGENPAHIKSVAREQLEKYERTTFIDDSVTILEKRDVDSIFKVVTEQNGEILGKYLILATGVDDGVERSSIKGIERFFGNSVIHCPYCHGYEFAGGKAGVSLQNPAMLKHMVPTIFNWNKDLTVFSNNESLNAFGIEELTKRGVKVITEPIVEVNGDAPYLKSVTLASGDQIDLDVLYTILDPIVNLKEQIAQLGVEFGEDGLIKTEKPFQNTNISGVFAAGDCQSFMRSLVVSTYSGQMAGVGVAHSLQVSQWSNV